ncbi:hypothetical protein [Bosea sp. 2RAB26]|uniref:hypothetical protein n=1 Tax=Bosea sp. 2RAB26 TaxID=3237476 RepID=UPI003F92FCC5
MRGLAWVHKDRWRPGRTEGGCKTIGRKAGFPHAGDDHLAATGFYGLNRSIESRINLYGRDGRRFSTQYLLRSLLDIGHFHVLIPPKLLHAPSPKGPQRGDTDPAGNGLCRMKGRRL